MADSKLKYLDYDGLQYYHSKLQQQRNNDNKVIAAALDDLDARNLEVIENIEENYVPVKGEYVKGITEYPAYTSYTLANLSSPVIVLNFLSRKTTSSTFSGVYSDYLLDSSLNGGIRVRYSSANTNNMTEYRYDYINVRRTESDDFYRYDKSDNGIVRFKDINSNQSNLLHYTTDHYIAESIAGITTTGDLLSITRNSNTYKVIDSGLVGDMLKYDETKNILSHATISVSTTSNNQTLTNTSSFSTESSIYDNYGHTVKKTVTNYTLNIPTVNDFSYAKDDGSSIKITSGTTDYALTLKTPSTTIYGVIALAETDKTNNKSGLKVDELGKAYITATSTLVSDEIPFGGAVETYVQQQIGSAIANATKLKGGFDASTGALSSGTLTSVAEAVGDMYICTTAGTYIGTEYEVGDSIIFQKIVAAGMAPVASDIISIEGTVSVENQAAVSGQISIPVGKVEGVDLNLNANEKFFANQNNGLVLKITDNDTNPEIVDITNARNWAGKTESRTLVTMHSISTNTLSSANLYGVSTTNRYDAKKTTGTIEQEGGYPLQFDSDSNLFTIIPTFEGTIKGLVPASDSTDKFLRSDGTWAYPDYVTTETIQELVEEIYGTSNEEEVENVNVVKSSTISNIVIANEDDDITLDSGTICYIV